MKKSEFIRKIMHRVQSNPPPTENLSDYEYTELVIDMFIELGMKPPPIPGKSEVRINNRCKWEPENE